MEIADFRKLFRETFRDGAPPAPERVVSLTRGDVERRREILQAFSGRRWQELDTDFVISQADAMSFMEPEAVHYYLPAFMLAALDVPPEDYLPLTVVCGLFLPLRRNAADPIRRKFENTLSLFSARERDAVKRFLVHIAEKSLGYSLRREAALALRFYRQRGLCRRKVG